MDNKVTIPVVGMGITIQCGSDQYPGTIKHVSETKRTFTYTKDYFRAAKGSNPYGNQIYTYRETNDAVYTARYAKNGRFYTLGGMRHGMPISLGIKRAYRDPSF